MRRHVVRTAWMVALVTALACLSGPALAAAPSDAPTSTPATSTAASPAAPVDPRLPHDAVHLEALLPDAVAGTALFKVSYGPPTWALLGPEGTASFVAISDAFERDIDDLTMAFANDPTAVPVFNLFAIEVAGVPGAAVAETYGQMAQQAEVGSTLSPATLGGVPVIHLAAPNNPIRNVWFLGVDGVMLGIQATTEAQAEQLLGLLPTSVPAASPSAAP